MADEPPQLSPSEEARRAESKRFSEHNYNRAQTLAAWLLATLVAVNTSGAAAILTAKLHYAALSGFSGGVVFAILSGIASWGEAFNKAGLHYVQSLPAPDEDEQRTADKCKKWAPRLFAAALVFNMLALAGFIVGCVIAARSLP
jgi:hypothetical protein